MELLAVNLMDVNGHSAALLIRLFLLMDANQNDLPLSFKLVFLTYNLKVII